jgi:hypothetical protein
MAKLVSSGRVPPPELSCPSALVLDVSWTFSLRRTPGSDELAARMSDAALGALGQYGRPVDPRTADAVSHQA